MAPDSQHDILTQSEASNAMPSSTATAAHAEAMDVGRPVREAFPALARQVREQPLVYLDNAATT